MIVYSFVMLLTFCHDPAAPGGGQASEMKRLMPLASPGAAERLHLPLVFTCRRRAGNASACGCLSFARGLRLSGFMVLPCRVVRE